MKNLSFITLFFLFASCSTPLMEEATQIKLISIEQKSELNCSFISLIYGGAFWGANAGQNMESSMNKMLNDAYQKGANAVYVRNMESNETGAGVVAEALSCE